ncbi:MAG: VOC family protein [Nitrospiraceae bacterium]
MELPHGRNRRRGRHQRRHCEAGARGTLAGNMLFYIDVEDLAVYRKRIVAAGGKIHVEDQEVPGMGAFSLFTDPEGRMMGLWKAKKK